MRESKNAIALLITVMFVIVITVAIGFGLKQVNSAAKIIKDENFMYQSSVIVEDVLNILKNSADIARAADSNSSDELFILLSSASFIPFESSGVEIILKLHSARAKFNPAQLDANTSQAFVNYLTNNMINSQYLDILLDNVSGIKEDNSYNSAIFEENPYLFRDYIASAKHLQIINDFYSQEYNDNSLEKINLKNLFYFTQDKNISIDLNYATTEVWELLLGTTKERAEFLSINAGTYTDDDSLNLDTNELEKLHKFKTSFFEPFLLVEIEIRQNNSISNIQFEYDIKNKKGSNFVYEI
ncbi:hypothetical protein [Sulfurimonas sp.]|jgi:hypothetical protein|uniref:hypothetical protein n=1 Tax=Sulfurimonas sp. TaxID=2022749 RepID=UPI0025D49FBC|nr:hypothetical protein [Sulfurimonas sp.]MBT5935862.1 hypothetical protein [Sulfurimonas sp.]